MKQLVTKSFSIIHDEKNLFCSGEWGEKNTGSAKKSKLPVRWAIKIRCFCFTNNNLIQIYHGILLTV